MDELVGKEDVDKLGYMGWMVDQSEDPIKKVLLINICVLGSMAMRGGGVM